MNQMDTIWKSRLQKTQRGCSKVLGKWAGRLKVSPIMLRAPLETGPCMRQCSIIHPLVTHGACIHPAWQVSLRHTDSAKESVRFRRFFITAQEEGLLKSRTCYFLAIWRVCHSQGLPWFCFAKVARTCTYHVQKGWATEAAGLGSLTPNFSQALAFIRPSWGLNKELIYSWLTFCRNKTLICASCPAPYLLLFCLFCKVTLI